MKKGLIILILIVGLLSFFIRPSFSNLDVRIVANSNETEDLTTKKLIKDVVLEFLEEIFEDYNSDHKEIINHNIHILIQRIKKIEPLITVKFNGHTFYTKTYNYYGINKDTSNTLLILLNNALGSNWWVTVYPNFIGIDSNVEFKSLFKRFINLIRG